MPKEKYDHFGYNIENVSKDLENETTLTVKQNQTILILRLEGELYMKVHNSVPTADLSWQNKKRGELQDRSTQIIQLE